MKYSKEYNFNWRVAAALFTAESAYRPFAVSYVGARGLGQMMPETAADLGVADPMDPQQNISGSIRYMKGLWSQWSGYPNQLELTLASYNAGPGAVSSYGGIPPYRETINYVRTIQGYYRELQQDDRLCYHAQFGQGGCPIAAHHNGNSVAKSGSLR